MWNNHESLTAAQALAQGRRCLAKALSGRTADAAGITAQQSARGDHSPVESAAPDVDAEVLLRHVLQVDRTRLYRDLDKQISRQEQEQYQKLLERRARGEPVAYLTGFREFMSLEIAVGPEVLIPRPETELLVEIILNDMRPFTGQPRIADVGTGSGAIAVSLAYYLPEAKVWAVDISPAALKVAEQNARKHGVAPRLAFLEGDLLTALPEDLNGGLDWVAANLPYIPCGEIPHLQPEVALYEPRLALDGGPDGLEIYRRLIPQAWKYLKPGGKLIMEMGWDQGQALAGIPADGDWQAVEIVKDYAGLDRFVIARKPPRGVTA